jgi:hypothetical protein
MSNRMVEQTRAGGSGNTDGQMIKVVLGSDIQAIKPADVLDGEDLLHVALSIGRCDWWGQLRRCWCVAALEEDLELQAQTPDR